jgi:hypothetical protein
LDTGSKDDDEIRVYEARIILKRIGAAFISLPSAVPQFFVPSIVARRRKRNASLIDIFTNI